MESRRTEGGLLSLKGFTPALSPEWTWSVQASYDIHLGAGTLMPLVQIAYSDEYNMFDIELDQATQDSYVIFDARLVWTSASGSVEVQGFVLNIGDEEVVTRAVIFNPTETLTSIQANWNNPRTWGVSVSYMF